MLGRALSEGPDILLSPDPSLSNIHAHKLSASVASDLGFPWPSRGCRRLHTLQVLEFRTSFAEEPPRSLSASFYL